MTAATWIAILILGPGSIAVFVLFLRDAVRLLREPGDRRGDATKNSTPPG